MSHLRKISVCIKSRSYSRCVLLAFFHRSPSIRTGTSGWRHRDGHDRRRGTGGRRARGGSVGFENLFQVRSPARGRSGQGFSRQKRQKKKRKERGEENGKFGIPAKGGQVAKRGSEKSTYDDPRSVWRRVVNRDATRRDDYAIITRETDLFAGVKGQVEPCGYRTIRRGRANRRRNHFPRRRWSSSGDSPTSTR